MIDTILFDLDGTLLNTLLDLSNSTNFALEKFGFPRRSVEEVRAFVGNGLRRLIEQAVPDGTTSETVDAVLSAMKSHYQEHCADETTLYHGISELIDNLLAAGFRLAIVSNKAAPMTEYLREKFFDGRIGVAIGESPLHRRKPAPDMLLAAAERLGSSLDHAVYVGDSEVDVLTAKNAKIPCLSVGWGFRSAQDLIAAGVRNVCQSPQELQKALLSLVSY